MLSDKKHPVCKMWSEVWGITEEEKLCSCSGLMIPGWVTITDCQQIAEGLQLHSQKRVFEAPREQPTFRFSVWNWSEWATSHFERMNTGYRSGQGPMAVVSSFLSSPVHDAPHPPLALSLQHIGHLKLTGAFVRVREVVNRSSLMESWSLSS